MSDDPSAHILSAFWLFEQVIHALSHVIRTCVERIIQKSGLTFAAR